MGAPALDTDPHGFDRLFRSGLDTAQIAVRTGCAEAYVANALHRLREARMAPAANDCAPAPPCVDPNDPQALYRLARRKGFSVAEAMDFADRNKGRSA